MILSSQRALLTQLDQSLASAGALPPRRSRFDLDTAAARLGVDVSKQPLHEHLDESTGLRRALTEFDAEIDTARSSYSSTVQNAGDQSKVLLTQWGTELADLETRLNAKQEELKAVGLQIQAGEVKRLTDRLAEVCRQLTQFDEKVRLHNQALRDRAELLRMLGVIRDGIFQIRRHTLKRITQAANSATDGPLIHVYFRQGQDRRDWARWIGTTFGFRSPRVDRIASAITPAELAEAIWKGPGHLRGLVVRDPSGKEEAFAPDPEVIDGAWDRIFDWETRFILEAWRLEDLPRIELEQVSGADRKPFDHLSAGQQRSILLSIMLFSSQNDPLVLDQPEDHLDSQYVAGAVVRHLEAAKERRQVILATHSANLTVLGDAELVVPLYSDGHHGREEGSGAVDRPVTRQRVCDLLEGGADAFRRRGERYGFRINSLP
jgi:DNA repair exonuclease SbcCD ATPase subunit